MHFTEKIEVRDINGDVKQGLLLVDNFGFPIELNEALEYIQKLRLIYERENIEKEIKELTQNMLIRNEGLNLEEHGRYYVHWKKVYNKKEFDPEKRDWGFKCSWCGKKVSSKVDKEYYSLMMPKGMRLPDHPDILSHKACSEACIKHVYDEYFEAWLKHIGLPTNLGLK